MKRLLTYLLLVILPMGSFILCFDREAVQPEESQVPRELVLRVSPHIASRLYPVTRTEYRGEEMDALFRQLLHYGDHFCRKMYDMPPADNSRLERFIDDKYRDEFRRFWKKGAIHSLIAGCWNFFMMNDSRPDIDFRLVKRFYPEKKTDCYGVGLLQPYIMHNTLSCTTLTMVDIDWRILDAHRQLVRLFRRGALDSKDHINRILAGVRLGWSAYTDPLVPSFPGALSHICQPYQFAMCEEQLRLFQKNIVPLEGLEFQIAALHDGILRKSHGDAMPVVFLSNALEDIYTTEEQFKKFMDSISAVLKPGEFAVLVYHVGGRPQFGIYELHKAGNSWFVRTRCRDTYLSHTVNGNEPEENTTHFEEFSVNMDPVPSCYLMAMGQVVSNPRNAVNK